MSDDRPVPVFAEVHRMSSYVPVVQLGTDDQGRTRVMCPTCHDEDAVIEPDGRLACPSGDAVARFLADALARYRPG